MKINEKFALHKQVQTVLITAFFWSYFCKTDRNFLHKILEKNKS